MIHEAAAVELRLAGGIFFLCLLLIQASRLLQFAAAPGAKLHGHPLRTWTAPA